MSIKTCQQMFILAFIILMSSAFVYAQDAPNVAMISADELKTKVESNHPVTIIDVRSSEGYASSSTTIKGAIHFKVRKLRSRLIYAPLKDLPKDREIVTYCACPKDESSIAAAQILQAAGFKRVRVLQGGWQEWLRANGPVEPRMKTD
jgi:rhodanese-related sulfurtransferase